MINEIKRIKKVELHLHLDGSVSPLLASKLSGLSITECIKKMQVDNDNQNLGEYLTKFDFPISLMQTEENLEIIAFDLVNRLEKENVIYAEIRFAPYYHLKNGLNYNEVINSKYLDDILDAGTEKMKEIFKTKYEDMKKKIGLSR